LVEVGNWVPRDAGSNDLFAGSVGGVMIHSKGI
jgi:hypothetical protein